MDTDEAEGNRDLKSMPASNLTSLAEPISSPPSLRQRALSASWWSIAPQPFFIAIRFLQSVIVARFLQPEDFGLMAIVGLLLNGLAMFSDLGTQTAAIRSANGDNPDFLRTTWTLSILRGAILWLLCVAAAIPFAHFYDDPLLNIIIPIAGATMLISSFGTTAGITFARNIDPRIPTLLVIAMGPIGFVINVVFAVWMKSVWALVWSSVLTTLISVVLGHYFLPGIRHRLVLKSIYFSELIHFGKWVFLSTLFTFIGMQADKLLLAKLVDFSTVGVYGIALVLAHVPQMLISPLSQNVLFPVLSAQFRSAPDRFADQALAARRLLLILGLILCLAIFLISPLFFRILYKPEFWDAGWMTRWMIASIWFTVLYTTSGHAALAIGDSRTMAISNGLNALITVAACFAGFYVADVRGFILGYAMGTAAGELVTAIQLQRAGLGFLAQDLKATFVGLLCILAILFAGEFAESLQNQLRYPVQVMVGLLIIGWIVWKSFPDLKNLVSRYR
ncbi:MAG: oligosaccharide flippase family protein [Pirellula sp.]